MDLCLHLSEIWAVFVGSLIFFVFLNLEFVTLPTDSDKTSWVV